MEAWLARLSFSFVFGVHFGLHFADEVMPRAC